MDGKDNRADTDKIVEEGVICKAVGVENQEVTDEELRKINKFTLTPLAADEVFSFKLIMGDNGLDDRNYEPFNLNALKDLQKLYIGKTMIKDHRRTADNQIARVYDTELVQDSSELYSRLTVMPKSISQDDVEQYYYNQLTSDIGKQAYNAMLTDTTGKGNVEVELDGCSYKVSNANDDTAEPARSAAATRRVTVSW